MHQIASSCLGVTSLIPLFLGGGEIDLFKILYSIDTDDISSSLLGEYELDENDNRVYTSGIYSLKLLNGSFHADAKYATDSLVEGALLTYATDVISPEKIESITTVDGVKLDPEKPNYDFTAWPNELAALVDAISELQTVEHLDEINTKADNIADILPPEIGAAEIDVITRAASNSILLSGIVEEKLVTFIKNEPTIGYAAQDPDIVWMDTILVDEFGNENVDKGELNSLLKAFVIYSDDKKAMDFNDHDSLINGLAQLLYPMENSSEELDYSDVISFASSQVLMTIVSKEIPSINTGGSGVSIVVPYSLNTTKEGNDDAWKNWAYDTTFDYKNGEFARLVEVLYHAREYKRTVATFQDETQEIILRQDNLVHSIIYMEKDDLVTKSKVLHASLSQGIIDKRDDVHSIIKVRENAIENNPNLNPDSISNYDVISAIEVDRALDVIRYMELDFNGNDLSDVNIASFLKAINGSKSAEARESICKSNIFNISTVNKITEGSEETENKGIDVPYLYKHVVDSILSVNLEDSKWYPEAFDANDNTWEECELNKMLLSIVALGIGADDTNTQLSIPTSKELFDTLKDESKLDVVYDSDVFKYTISCKIINQGEIVVRDIAYEEYDPADPNIRLEVIKQDEIKKVVTFLDKAEINIDNKELDAQHIFSKLKDPKIGASLRAQICKSNILNATTVDKIGGNDGPVPETYSLVFPKAYLNLDGSVNKDASLWYPQSFAADDTTWIDCELNKLLISVVELDIVASGNTINLSINEKIDMLLDDSVVEPLDDEENKNTKLDVVYHSDIIADTISRRLTDTGVEIPYIDSNKKPIFDNIEGRRKLDDHIIHEDEVETLLKAVFNLGFTFNSTKKFDYEHIFDDISLSDLSSNINNSEVSILNSSILHLLVSSELIKQKLSIDGSQYSIVTRNYMKDSSSSVTVVDTFEVTELIVTHTYDYIKKDEIKIAINSLSLAGITKVDEASTINSDKLRELFVTNKDSDNSKQLIENISQSAILSKIFGQILISDKYTIGTEEYSYYQAVGYVAHGQLDYYKLTSASEINGDSVAILSQEDVRSIISNFYKLS